MSDYPHVPAAFINAIREEGTKVEACDYLQEQWNETCALRAEKERLQEALERADATIKTADALAEFVGLVISTTDPRVYLQAFDGVRVSHDAYHKSRATPRAITQEEGE